MSHVQFMGRVLELAKQGAGRVAPNPMVGAVIVREGRVIAEGYHRKRGGPHAERNALAHCPEPQGATLYVNLEPCCHYGHTPPCTEAILASGISHVVVGMLDPNPLVSGKGVERLRDQGVKVEVGVLEQECMDLNEVFVHYITTRRPYVAMKYAMTADGKIATRTGDSRWITSRAAREYVHRLRHLYTGIAVGIGTVLADDPLLNCRMEGGKQPVRIVCDSKLRIPLESRIVRTAREYPTLVATISGDRQQKKQLEEQGVEILTAKERAGQVDLTDLMVQLGRRDIDSILLEGGGTLNYSALEQGMVQKGFVFVGAKIFGGATSLSPVEGMGVAEVTDAFSLSLREVTRLDKDVLLEYGVEAR